MDCQTCCHVINFSRACVLAIHDKKLVAVVNVKIVGVQEVSLFSAYPNGSVIKRVTACNYTTFESRDEELGWCQAYCPQSDLLCPRPDPTYTVPSALTKRGLQVRTALIWPTL